MSVYGSSDNVLLRLQDAATYLQISLTTLWRLGESDPTFPRKIKLSSRVACYKRQELDAWLQQKKL